MATLKLDAVSGGSVSLVGSDTASTYSITVPLENAICMIATSATGAIKVATGTTAQRPALPEIGDIRYNTTLSTLEYYNGVAWLTF